MVFKDQLDRTLQIKKTPIRIVSLVPSQTELLVDLGLETFIVGITKFCVHPNHLRKTKTIVGGTKQVHLDKIQALHPDIILCNKEENTKTMIKDLEQIAPVHVSDVYTINDAFELIDQYGAIFKVKPAAEQLVTAIKKERSAFKSHKKELHKVAYFIWKAPWMVAGDQTYINTMLQEANYDNVFGDNERYPSIALEDETLNRADVIFLSSEPYPFKEKHVEALQHKFPDKKIKIVDGEMFSWYGSRLLKAYRYFQLLEER